MWLAPILQIREFPSLRGSPIGAVIRKLYCRGPLSDIRKPVGVIEGVIDSCLPCDSHRLPSACRVVCVGDGALRSRFRSQSIESVVCTRDCARHRVDSLRHPIPSVVRVSDRAFIRGICLRSESCKRSAIQIVVAIGRDFAATIQHASRTTGSSSSIVVKRLIVVKCCGKPFNVKRIGRGGGDRTHDLRLKRPLLYH